MDIQTIKNRFGIIGNSDHLNFAIKVAMQVAPTDMTVLITGESGVGKESFSKIIHQLSARKHGQFIAVNCGAIPEGTIDSELFGHEKGSFTGAYDSRKGYFEVTDGGTIFLDEIGEMPLPTQSRLLRVLENGEFIRVGSSKVVKTDVRVVAATNVNLIQAVEKGKFREDLYYRLNTVPIFVPPLRERGNDIELLFRKFTSDFAEKHHVNPIKLTEDAKEALLAFRYPGNIRQLKNIAEQISLLEMEREVNKEILLKYLPQEGNMMPAIYKSNDSSSGGKDNFSERDILYKILFDMRNDVEELKKLVHNVLKNENYGEEIIKDHEGLFEVKPNEFKENEEGIRTPFLLDSSKHDDSSSDSYNLEEYQDAEHEIEEESLSLEKKEKEMIQRALSKNQNKRKYAARDLGISERTLYRKIKQYDL
ncbi:sigma-54 interaction domain-containing protein [Marivirga arenosa]|uniref:Sigma-54 dependent transcriptional regulator n=1 Tax=Marivirga arenosa TaxID=3059076 RepID=A0AA51N5L8_9BACT|nr:MULTISPECIES: sigma-54 dependent transcriptional regulator [unclassified Marivirga]WMN06557.1 sigma-54 dependent transcriptional regulator [Marivirga sp. ABR2-2]WNB17112.1 sigma-54 dependent transcriptional regulator [Marivirga sp. BKB1-2]